jgi:hypothetical protein
MRLFECRAKREPLSRDAIIAEVSKSNNFDPAEDLKSADGFIIFEDSFQKSWLVATKLRLYNIIDDTRKKEASINWSISRSKIIIDSELSLDIEIRGDIIDIGYRIGNPFSSELFSSGDVKEKILSLVRKEMI